jgi:DNA-binding NarL/FixJ family response regulator
MNKFVYVLSNESMPGTYKIGKTSNIKTRLKDLDSTSNPTPFKVEILFECEDHDYVEKKMHKIFSDYRVRSNREFFRTNLLSVRKAFKSFPGKIVEYSETNHTNNKIINCKLKNDKSYTKTLTIEEKIAAIHNLRKNGQTTKEIAKQLGISTSTIYNYMQRL